MKQKLETYYDNDDVAQILAKHLVQSTGHDWENYHYCVIIKIHDGEVEHTKVTCTRTGPDAQKDIEV